jgi:hypothetical protein
MTIDSTHNNELLPTAHQPPGARLVEVLLIVLIFFVVAGDPPPHVNEPHYLCRLKHFWNPQWCAGDLFLQSRDTQLVFIWAFGWVTRWLSLSATAWLGRLIVWTFIAWAWQRLSWRLAPRPFAAVLSAALFVSLNEWAHLAGEWVVGGVEAKCFAYGFVLMALRALVDRRWNAVWLSLGAATSFHPLVGGWSVLVCSGIWLFSGRCDASLRKMLPGLVCGAALGLVGILPAITLAWDAHEKFVREAYRIYVFERLPHHLALLTLPTDEIVRRLARHATLLAILWVAWRAVRTLSSSGATERAVNIQRIVQFAWGAALLAVVGFAIELSLWSQPLAAAPLLRYYWFRLTDFAAPMAVALCITTLIAIGFERRRTWAVWILTAAIVLTSCHLAYRTRERAMNPVPPADARMSQCPAWVEACEWVAENTPPESLFLTPRLNHSFKWRTGRPEVVNRKDIPQDVQGIIEWHKRIQDIYYDPRLGGLGEPLDSLGILGTDRVRELALKYGAQFALMDRGQLLQLPIAHRNEEYVVYRIEESRDGR